MPRRRPIIALLTDFGTTDWFVGSLKGAILARVPECAVVDLCHTIEPGAIAQGAWLLEHTFRDFPAGTVFCAVVDPGVGTARRALAASGGGYFFAAPDNGLLSGAAMHCSGWQCRALENPKWRNPIVSSTFHGRDVFAPAAAMIAREGSIEAAGPPVADPVTIVLPHAVCHAEGRIEGEIICFDRFGNAVTTIEQSQAASAGGGDWVVESGALTIPQISATFAEVGHGELVAYWGSLGTLEIAVRDGNARERLGLKTGRRILLHKGRT